MGNIGPNICLVCVLSMGSLFFSVNSMALRIFSRAKLQEVFKKTGKKDYTDCINENAEKLILTSLIYQLILNTAILFLLFDIFAKSYSSTIGIGDFCLILVIAIMIFLAFNLAIPHAWAKYAAEKIIRRTFRFIMFLSIIVRPVLYILTLYDRLIRRLAGISEATPEEQQEEKQEEFLTDLELQKMEGVVDQEEQEMIENVLELSETAVNEIMTPRTDIVAIEANSDIETIIKTITAAGHSRLPVYETNIDNIIGLLYAKDLLTEIFLSKQDFNLRQKMRKAYFVPETKPLRALLHEFQNQNLHIAIVLDEYGGTAGIITLEDILEELVGEITDEYEQKPPEPIREIDDDTIELDARTYIDDVNDRFGINLPEEEDYDTIGGFVFSHLGYIPKSGETFEFQNLKFIITSAETRKIKKLRIQKKPPQEEKNAD